MFKPLHDFVLIRPDDAEEVTAGGIVVPDVAKDKPREGVVIAAGHGRFEYGVLKPVEVSAGDRVTFGKYAGTEIKLDDVLHLIMREEEIMGITGRVEKQIADPTPIEVVWPDASPYTPPAEHDASPDATGDSRVDYKDAGI